MAKKAKPAPGAGGKLAGKKVAFVGKFGYRDGFLLFCDEQVARSGGKVVKANEAAPDMLCVGEGRGGKPPAEVAKLQKKHPAMEVFNLSDFLKQLVPTPDEVLQEIAKGQRPERDSYWEDLGTLCGQAGAQIDLTKADLRQAHLRGAHLGSILLTGSDLRGANTRYTRFGDLEKVNLDQCVGSNVYLCNLKSCTFRSADLEHAWMFWATSKNVEKCDFSGAKMSTARLERGTLVDCKFVEADLSDAKMEHSIFERANFSKANLTRIHAERARFDGATLAKANLTRADLRGASLARVDLRNANLREAVLCDADLTGANIAGADFQDAVLTGAKLQGLDLSKAKNLALPAVRAAGPKLLELAAAAVGAKNFSTKAEVDLGQDEFARLELSVNGNRIGASSFYRRAGNQALDRIPAPTFEQGLLNLADRWPKGTLRLDSIQAKGSKTVRGAKLQELATAAWAETFGVALASPEQLKAQRADQEAQAIRERDQLMEQIRKQGAKAWDAMDYRLRRRLDLRGADLSGAKLDKLDMMAHKLKGAKFAGSSLIEAEFWNTEMAGADFTGANLAKSRFDNADLARATFRDADLTGAKLTNTKLIGADFTGAKLKDANFSKAQFDQTTVFPPRFSPPSDMVWKGDGPRPGVKKAKAAKAGSLSFESFLEQLNKKVEAERMKKAGAMLKAERFQLFADVKEDSVVGVVKSQSDPDLVYSCRLAADGAFSCCTQNLRPCGGLRGALCKHLLVLIVGLAKAGQLDAATVNYWIDLSQGHKPAIDQDVMSATFLRYKGAEAGEVDWRPTETIPEDFYAM